MYHRAPTTTTAFLSHHPHSQASVAAVHWRGILLFFAAAELTYASRWGPWGGELERVTCRGAYVERFMHAVFMGVYADLESTHLQSRDRL